MEIREGSEKYSEKLDSNENYSFTLDVYKGECIYATDMRIVMTGKELKRIVELINTFNKIQDNPAPIEGLGNMLDMLKNFGGKK